MTPVDRIHGRLAQVIAAAHRAAETAEDQVDGMSEAVVEDKLCDLEQIEEELDLLFG